MRNWQRIPSAGRRRVGQRQVEDGNRVPLLSASADGDDAVVAGEVDALDHGVGAQDLGLERQGEVVLHHRVEPRHLLRKVTGQLGEVMSESAQIGLSYVRSHLEQFEIDPEVFDKSDIHIHFPAGATPKDGPSAGIAITTAIVSLLGWKKGRKIRSRLAMTGEMTLRGEVLPIGGIREKCLAARRAGVRDVLVPQENARNVAEIPKHILRGLHFHYVETYDDVLRLAF